MVKYLLQIGCVAGLGWFFGGILHKDTMNAIGDTTTPIKASSDLSVSFIPPSSSRSSMPISPQSNSQGDHFSRNPHRFKFCMKDIKAFDPNDPHLQVGLFRRGSLLEVGRPQGERYAYARYQQQGGSEIVALVYQTDIGGAIP